MSSTLTEAVILAFGQVAFANNANIKISGSGNSGTVQNNNNLELSCSESNLNLKNNRNANLNLKNSTLDCVNSSNVNLNCEGGVLKINNDVNLKISTTGASSRVESSQNKNLHLEVTETEAILSNNTNVKVKTKDMFILAKNNVNLNILGENNWITVENTKDHEIRRSNTQDRNKLLFAFKPDKNSSTNTWSSGSNFSMSTTTSGETNEVRRSIEYVDKAEINGEYYSTGMFNYVIKQNSDTDFEIKFEGEKFERLATEAIAPSQVILSAVRNDKKESLSVEAPMIVQEEGSRERGQPIFLIKMRNIPSSI